MLERLRARDAMRLAFPDEWAVKLLRRLLRYGRTPKPTLNDTGLPVLPTLNDTGKPALHAKRPLTQRSVTPNPLSHYAHASFLNRPEVVRAVHCLVCLGIMMKGMEAAYGSM